MYPQRQLTALAWHKARQRQRIGLRRAECAAAVGRIAQPFVWLDRMLVLWRRLAPVAAIPLALLAGRKFSPRGRLLGSLIRWAPAILGLARTMGRTAKSRT